MPLQNIPAPLAGISRSTAYQTHPPFTAYDAVNMLPFDAKTGRRLLATRPAVVNFAYSSECNMLSRINGVRSAFPVDSFAAALWDGASSTNSLFIWNGSSLVAATGAQANSIDRGRYVSASPQIGRAHV